MQEPKKYTAKEAMHWMIDHQGGRMREANYARLYCFDGRQFLFEDCLSREAWSPFDTRKGFPETYIEAEYDAWQAAEKAEEEEAKESEPREGESLYKYMKRDGGDYKKQSELEDSRQRWIESYVRREIAKATEGK